VVRYVVSEILPRSRNRRWTVAEQEVADRLRSRQEVAKFLGVPPATLARWAYEGTGPSFFKVGRHTRYRFADVVAWLEKNRGGRS